jgi:uncharacterized membrane protein YraQ (UPF0718 family)
LGGRETAFIGQDIDTHSSIYVLPPEPHMNLVTFADHVATQLATSFLHNWPFLLLGTLAAAALKVYVGTDRVAAVLRRRTDVAVAGSVAAAVATPFCSCGTTAVVISMLASSVPWAPVVAFMVASPLSSPEA